MEAAEIAGTVVFAVSGVIAVADRTVAVLAGLITGVGGGVIRDVLAGRTPLVMGGEIYATAALAGVAVFVGLDELAGVHEAVSATLGGLVILGLRVSGIRRQWSLPPLSRAGGAG